jgi:predicted negative regulator of RcsB-dependent stress response
MKNKIFFNIILLIITIIGVGGSFGYIYYKNNKKMATLDVFDII